MPFGSARGGPRFRHRPRAGSAAGPAGRLRGRSVPPTRAARSCCPAAERSCELQQRPRKHDAAGACALGGISDDVRRGPPPLRTPRRSTSARRGSWCATRWASGIAGDRAGRRGSALVLRDLRDHQPHARRTSSATRPPWRVGGEVYEIDRERQRGRRDRMSAPWPRKDSAGACGRVPGARGGGRPGPRRGTLVLLHRPAQRRAARSADRAGVDPPGQGPGDAASADRSAGHLSSRQLFARPAQDPGQGGPAA